MKTQKKDANAQTVKVFLGPKSFLFLLNIQTNCMFSPRLFFDMSQEKSFT